MATNKKTAVFPLVIAGGFHELPYLPLGMVVAYLRVHGEGRLLHDFDVHPLMLGSVEGHPLELCIERIAAVERPVCLLSSYVWNIEHNLDAARRIKAANPGAFILMGGPEVPKYQDETEAFLEENDCVDIAVLGEGEVSCAEVLDEMARAGGVAAADFSGIDGIVFRAAQGMVRTGARDRIVNVNELPSPYLNAEFEPWFQGMDYTVLETNRGCPYGCTYCDWGSATLQKVTRFSPQRVVDEIQYIAEKQSQSIFIADANFGMLEQDIEIAQALVDIRARTGYPKRLFTNFAKNGGRRLMAVIKILHEGGLLPTGIIALQTTDDDTLKAIKRDNIKTSAYEKMMEYFNSERIPMASDIMIGLPGQTVDSLQQDLQFCFDWKVSANGNYTSMMPNAPMAERSYREEHQIRVDSDGLIASTSSFSTDELLYMKCLYLTYQFHVRLGILKYYIYYLQIEHDVPALTLLRRWLDRVRENDPQNPLCNRVWREIFAIDKRDGHWALMGWGEEASFLFSDLEPYCLEFHDFACREFDIDIDDSVIQTLVSTQAAVTPRVGRRYPYTAELPHDVVGYFNQVKSVPSLSHLEESFVPLQAFPPSELKVVPLMHRKTVEFQKIDGHSDDWEYKSPLRFH